MALNLIEKVAAAAAAPQATADGSGRKRTWGASNREDQGSDNANRHRQSDKRTSGSSSGGNHGRHWQYDSGHSGDRGPCAGGRSTSRSSEWKSRGYEHHSRGNSNRMAAAAEATAEEAAIPPLRCRHMATAAKVYYASFAIFLSIQK
jgi:hypothetical protein